MTKNAAAWLKINRSNVKNSPWIEYTVQQPNATNTYFLISCQPVWQAFFT